MKTCKHFLSVLLTVVILVCAVPVMNVGAASYTINGVTVNASDYSSSAGECWEYANKVYNKIWGERFTNSFSNSDNMLRNLSDSELTLTETHLKKYVSAAALGSCLRICNSANLHGNDGSGHSQIIVQKDANGFTVFEGGLADSPYRREHYYTWRAYMNTSWLTKYAYIKYIKWPGATPYSNCTFANLGDDFYAVILNTKSWKPISLNTSNDKITLETEKGVANQKWRFRRQSDGAYRIESCANGKVLEMTNGIREARTQLTAHSDWWEGYYQQWYLIPQGDGYIFQSKHFSSENWVMDLKDSDGHDGTIIQNYKRNNSTDQIWSVYKGDDVQLKRPTLKVAAGSATKKTTFTWNSVYGAKSYDVKIWKNKVNHSVDSYHTEWNTSSGYSIQLPPGTYEAYVVANDFFDYFGSADVKFTVAGSTASDQPVNLGNDFYAMILTNDAWVPVGYDYSSTRNVFLQKKETQANSAHQLWRFQRQSNGSYAISSAQDGRFLEMREGQHTENTPVAAMSTSFWDGAYQKWWIYESSTGGYFIECDHFTSQGWYLTLKDNKTTIGTQITACSLSGKTGQIWDIYKQSEVQLKAPTLTVKAGTSTSNTSFSWPHVFGANGFTIKVWKNQVNTSVNPDYSQTVTGTSGTLALPAGTYEALVTASNQYQSYNSNKVKFTVQQATYQINYNYNGGTSAPMSQTKVHGQDLVLTTVVPYRVGYVFQNWNTKLDGTGTTYMPGSTYKANSAATLYAAWKVCTHTWSEGTVLRSATCTETGSAKYECTICNATKTETIATNQDVHINVIDIEASASTCTVKGYSAGMYCNDCKKYISGHVEQPFAPHQTTVINAREATYDAEGYTGDTYCTVCKQTLSYGSSIPKLTKPEEPMNPTNPTQPTTQQQQQSGACKYCGGTHTGFPSIIIGFIHSILAMFGLHK